MSTRAILAVRQPDGDLHGVYHRFDSIPRIVGNELLRRIAEAEGDLDTVVGEVIRGAPFGWESLLTEERTGTDADLPMFHDAASLERAAWVEYLYLLDVEARTLSVWYGNPCFEGQLPEDPHEVVAIAEDGTAEPFVEGPAVWPTLPLEEDWSSDRAEVRAVRSRFAAHIQGLEEHHGQPEGTIRGWVERVLGHLIREARWSFPETRGEKEMIATLTRALQGDRPSPVKVVDERDTVGVDEDEPLYVRFFVQYSDPANTWRVNVDGLDVRFPCAGAFRQGIDPLVFWRASDERQAKVSPIDELLLRAAAEVPAPFETSKHLDHAPLMQVVLAAAVQAEHPDWSIRLESGRIARAQKAVAREARNLDEVALEDCPEHLEMKKGELLIRDARPTFQWLLVDWLRSGQVRGGLDAVTPGAGKYGVLDPEMLEPFEWSWARDTGLHTLAGIVGVWGTGAAASHLLDDWMVRNAALVLAFGPALLLYFADRTGGGDLSPRGGPWVRWTGVVGVLVVAVLAVVSVGVGATDRPWWRVGLGFVGAVVMAGMDVWWEQRRKA